MQTRRISIGADGLFRFDRSGLKDLLPEGRAKLELLARELKGNFARVVGITVIGHADRLGAASYNLSLSKHRAETVRALLMQHGLDGSVIRAEGRGEAEPVVACPDGASGAALKACLQPNRRVTVEITAQANP